MVLIAKFIRVEIHPEDWMEASLKESFSSGPGKALERKLLGPEGRLYVGIFLCF